MIEKYTTYSNLLGAVIQELREEQGLSQQGLAARLGVTRVTVSKIENGQSELNTPLILRLRQVFNGKDIFVLADEKRSTFKDKGIEVYDSIDDVPDELKTDDNTALKYIAGAAALATVFMLFK